MVFPEQPIRGALAGSELAVAVVDKNLHCAAWFEQLTDSGTKLADLTEMRKMGKFAAIAKSLDNVI